MGVCEKKENGSMVERVCSSRTDWLLWTETAASMTEVYKRTN